MPPWFYRLLTLLSLFPLCHLWIHSPTPASLQAGPKTFQSQWSQLTEMHTFGRLALGNHLSEKRSSQTCTFCFCQTHVAFFLFSHLAFFFILSFKTFPKALHICSDQLEKLEFTGADSPLRSIIHFVCYPPTQNLHLHWWSDPGGCQTSSSTFQCSQKILLEMMHPEELEVLKPVWVLATITQCFLFPSSVSGSFFRMGSPSEAKFFFCGIFSHLTVLDLALPEKEHVTEGATGFTCSLFLSQPRPWNRPLGSEEEQEHPHCSPLDQNNAGILRQPRNLKEPWWSYKTEPQHHNHFSKFLTPKRVQVRYKQCLIPGRGVSLTWGSPCHPSCLSPSKGEVVRLWRWFLSTLRALQNTLNEKEKTEHFCIRKEEWLFLAAYRWQAEVWKHSIIYFSTKQHNVIINVNILTFRGLPDKIQNAQRSKILSGDAHRTPKHSGW